MNARKTIGRAVAHKPPLTRTCDYCKQPFPAFAENARFCCNEHRTAHWKAARKLMALVDLFANWFQIGDSERARFSADVSAAAERFFAFAEWLGLKYNSKKYSWQRSI